MTRIDMHAHVIPPRYREGLGGMPLPPATVEDLSAMMGRYGIDAAVISTGPPGAFLGDQAAANRLARTANEEIAEIVRGAPGSFAGLAILPLPDVNAALAELAHALDELRLDGVLLLASTAGTYLGDPAWDALYEQLDRRGAYVFVHPGFAPNGQPIPEHPPWLYEFPFETTRALAQLIYSGTFERRPSIRFQFAHLGGAALFLAHRIASLQLREPELARAAPAGALEYLRRQFYDTGLTNDAPALAAAREVTTIDHILFGTDWPYVSLPDGADPAPALDGLGPQGRPLADGRNAAALVPRLARAVA